VPIHKKSDHRLVDNYHPIMLTSIIGKVLESIINNDLFMSYQHGFMPGKSCVTQLLYVMEIWTKSLDLGYPVDVI